MEFCHIKERKQHSGVSRLLTDEEWGTLTILSNQEYKKFATIVVAHTLESCREWATTRTPVGSLDIRYKTKHISKTDVQSFSYTSKIFLKMKRGKACHLQSNNVSKNYNYLFKKKRNNLFCLAHLKEQKTCVGFVTKKRKKNHNLGLP